MSTSKASLLSSQNKYKVSGGILSGLEFKYFYRKINDIQTTLNRNSYIWPVSGKSKAKQPHKSSEYLNFTRNITKQRIPTLVTDTFSTLVFTVNRLQFNPKVMIKTHKTYVRSGKEAKISSRQFPLKCHSHCQMLKFPTI